MHRLVVAKKAAAEAAAFFAGALQPGWGLELKPQ